MQKLVKYYMEYINKIGILGPSPNPYFARGKKGPSLNPGLAKGLSLNPGLEEK